MERLNLLVCLASIFVASSLATSVDPRGTRPVQPGTRSEKCVSQREWPFCTDDEWGSKCPSGCRIQGLMDQADHNLLKKIEKIRHLLDQNTAKHRSTDHVSKQTYDYLKDRLTTDAGNDNNYFGLAQNLRQRITEMKIKIDRQLKILAALKDRVKDQVIEMQRQEVDIDIKIRACKGSCSGYAEYQVDHESYVSLEKQVDQLDTNSAQKTESVGTLYVMKSLPLKEIVVDNIYKSGINPAEVSAQHVTDVFPDVKTVHLVLEQEGSSSSPATISKVSGTSYSPATSPSSTSSISTSSTHSTHSTHSTSSSSYPSSSSTSTSSTSYPSSSSTSSSSYPSSSSSTSTSSTSSTSSSSSSSSPPPSSSASITEFGGHGHGDLFGGGFESSNHPSTHHVSSTFITCTRTTRKRIVHTKDGPVEKVEEVLEGGPGCKVTDNGNERGLSSFFPSLSHTSPSSSSSSVTSKAVHTSGTKGSITEHSGIQFGDPFSTSSGFDLGAFHTRAAETDIPDFHARSVKSVRVERQADYVGKDCVDAYQNHLKGETNGLFTIKPGGTDSMGVVEVYCQQGGLMGGWLLVQQRESGVLSFNRTWAEYRNGFGSVDKQGKGELWLGNHNLHLLTNQSETMLRVELEDWEGGIASAEYTVRVGSEEEGYPLHVSGYFGDAGDALIMPKLDTASSHNGMKFSTFDKDNDNWEENCAEMYGGGWWYNKCQSANLNGIYYKGSYNLDKNTPYEINNGVVWMTYKPVDYSLKTVRMFIRPNAF